MECLKYLVFLTCLSTIFAQKTYRRACDCEYTIDGKCAYTLLLPKGQDTCAQGGSTGGGDSEGNSNDHMTSDVTETLMELQTNVSMLWSASGDQARMLNQLQSMFISYQDSMKMMMENMTMPSMNMSHLFPNMNMNMNMNMNDMMNATDDVMTLMMSNVTGAMNGALQAMEDEFNRLRSQMEQMQLDLSNQTNYMVNLNVDTNVLTNALTDSMMKLHQEMKTTYFLCQERGLLVSGKKVNITDDSISASSQFNENHHPVRSRINTMATAADFGAWCPAEPNKDEWIQVDLGTPRTIYAIVTRGRPDYEQWVTKYKLQYTETLADKPEDTVWVTYRDVLDEELTFDGNSDQNTKMINDLWQPIRVRFVRIVPTAAYKDSNKCMRVDLLGCVDSP